MNKNEIKDILKKYDLNNYNYYYKDDNYIYLQKRNNKYKDESYGLYIEIKISYNDLKYKKSIEYMTLNNITR